MIAATVAACIWAVAALATLPAHYIVFEFDAQGHAVPVFRADVELSSARDESVATPRASDSETERIAWRPIRNGVAGPSRQIEVPRFLRAEFAHDVITGLGTIDAHAVEAHDRSFVLRVGHAEAESIELMTDAGVQRFDLAALSSASEFLPLARQAPARVGHEGGVNAADSGNRLDILVLGDGYTSADQSVFNAHAATLKTAMFAVTPYREYESFVNWQTGFVSSAQSGSDHPPYQAGCSTAACCADTAAQSDTAAGTLVDTALDGRFCTNQIHRLLTVSSSKVLAAAAAYPDWDKILVTVNDPLYGGAGGSYAVTSAAAQAALIVIHEFGHSFHRLADEYSSAYPGFPACNDVSAGSGCEANVTNQTDANLVKWRSWFTPGNPIPTPAGTPGVGLFEGARYLTSGMYRPVNSTCLMRSLGTSFCPVCRQEYVKKLYRGGFGVPAAGIDLIEPDSQRPSNAIAVPYAVRSTRLFGATVLRPTIGSVSVQWYLDGNAIIGATADTHVYSQLTPTPATRTLEMRVLDQTAFVNATMADGLLIHSRAWTIEVGNDRVFADGFQ
ncbi:MAG: M64 family metallopeptidase [Dokdonella sp.]